MSHQGVGPARERGKFGLMMDVASGSMGQPLEMVAEYFGEAIAFYFAWMGFYTQGLIVPSIAGLVVFGFQCRAKSLDHPLLPIYSLFIIIWSSLLLLRWRQHCSELAYRWGVLNFEAEEKMRAQFNGKKRINELTGEVEIYYPTWKRWSTYGFTMPVIFGFTAAVLTLMLLVFVVRDDARSKESTIRDASWWVTLLIYPCLYGIMLPILYQGCKKLGIFLNDLENHKTENQYRNALIIKVFTFRFLTVFASLYFYAFFSHSGDNNWKLLRLAFSLFSFMTIGQWWYMVWITYIPMRVQEWRLGKLRAKVKSVQDKMNKSGPAELAAAGAASLALRKKLLEEAGDSLWEEALLKEYNLEDAFDDYTMSLIQFGYVTLFSAAFPLAPLLAMINNLIQTRVDAYKLCKTRRRPIAVKSSGIGVWDNVLELMTVVAVITNCALVGATSSQLWRLIPGASTTEKFLLIVALEHLILFIKYWVKTAVPRVPLKVQRALARDRTGKEAASPTWGTTSANDSAAGSISTGPAPSASPTGGVKNSSHGAGKAHMARYGSNATNGPGAESIGPRTMGATSSVGLGEGIGESGRSSSMRSRVGFATNKEDPGGGRNNGARNEVKGGMQEGVSGRTVMGTASSWSSPPSSLPKRNAYSPDSLGEGEYSGRSQGFRFKHWDQSG
ncbi:unnamed protein product [Discosporangium mesarthrocarpum]